ncbi:MULTISPECIES: FAD-dependent oxidoreductase [unclassified Paraburkholderia]|uniref:FAD-dependent oxidoreductase n=1 Tax=unclassified Paraburkholderia TaxID=2615204 RepID=UPI002AB05370|nr:MULTISPECIES: FAD-dependent oxidoreductase [unclassified Paraburkholderia]
MSFLQFNAATVTPPRQVQHRGSLGAAFSRWILANHGAHYRAVVEAQRSRAATLRATRGPAAHLLGATTQTPQVGIVGAGFAGMFAGLILQSLGIEFEVFEASDRVGGRIHTWYSRDYHADDVQRAGLYGEVGGMRLPQFSEDMLPVQQLALAVNAVLARNGLHDQQVFWRKFYYSSPEQRLRYNNMATPTTLAQSSLDSFNFGVDHGGDVPAVWVTPKHDHGVDPYLPINIVLDKVNDPFLKAINRSFAEGFDLLMQFDQYSMWDYLTTQFRLGDLGEYYDPAMGAKSDLLPWSVANYLETTNVGSGMYSVSFVEMVIAVYDWGGSKDPYRPQDPNIYMLTVDQGMQRFPDACRAVLDLQDAVTMEEGIAAQIQVGMLPAQPGGPYSYNPPNLTDDAQPPHASAHYAETTGHDTGMRNPARVRVHLRHEVTALRHDPDLNDGQGGMKVTVRNADDGTQTERSYPYVVTTLPNGAYLNGQPELNLLEGISFDKAQAIRECNYMASFKAFLTFKRQFWTEFGERQQRTQGYGAAATDRANRQIIYPSYGYAADQGVLQVYCWALDARKLGALDDKERIEECLKGIQYLYPDVDVYACFAGYNDGVTTKTWFWDEHAGGGAFALFKPGQFNELYPSLLMPEFDGRLNFAGECCSVHHGWIVGALDSAYNAVLNILQHAGAIDKIKQMQRTWGSFEVPDVEGDPASATVMTYAYAYNEVDRNAASNPAQGTPSIYGDQQYVFNGQVPAFVANYDTVPQSMKATAVDKQVLAMLNAAWDDNVAWRAKQPPKSVNTESAVQMLEDIYYGNNFQTIPAPKFWLKDDDEFARQQLAGFMPNLLEKVSAADLDRLISDSGIVDAAALQRHGAVQYVANYRRYLEACTVIPVGFYLAKPIVFFTVNDRKELMPVGIQLDVHGELFTPDMSNADNAWLLAKMQTNCAGQSLHDVGFHQLLTHQICAMVSIALFSDEVFNPDTAPQSAEPFQQHPVFKLLRPHVVKTVEFQQTIYNRGYNPYAEGFPATRTANGAPGVYNIGYIYDLIFSCGRIGNYQLQDKMYYDDDRFRFLDLALPADIKRRGVEDTPFSYAYVHDAGCWYEAIARFVERFVSIQYPGGDQAIAADIQLQRFFDKLIPAFNHVDGKPVAHRFPAEVKAAAVLQDVLTLFIWQFSVQHTVVNDGAYNHAAFVPNASTLMYPLPSHKSSSQWTPADVLACLPSQTLTYPAIGNMTFMDVQINASVTGQGPYPETALGRGVLEPSIDVLQDSYGFVEPQLREAVFSHYQDVVKVGEAIAARQARDTATYLAAHQGASAIPATVLFDLITPANVMDTIQT